MTMSRVSCAPAVLSQQRIPFRPQIRKHFQIIPSAFGGKSEKKSLFFPTLCFILSFFLLQGWFASLFLQVLCYPQYPLVNVVGEFPREGQGNDDVRGDAETFGREVLLEEAGVNGRGVEEDKLAVRQWFRPAIARQFATISVSKAIHFSAIAVLLDI